MAQIGFNDPTLVSLVPGDVLLTVSRRDARRQFVDVWTSGNRVYSCRGTQVLELILRAVAVGRTPAKEVARGLGRALSCYEHGLVLQASKQVLDLVCCEDRERAFNEEN